MIYIYIYMIYIYIYIYMRTDLIRVVQVDEAQSAHHSKYHAYSGRQNHQYYVLESLEVLDTVH